MSPGSLAGVRVVELGGIGPAPMCAMLLADLGAPPLGIPERFQLLNRGRAKIELDLESNEGKAAVLRLVDRAGALEPQFWGELVHRLGLEGEDLPDRFDHAHWPALRERLAATFRGKTRDERTEVLGETDTCFAPVLDLGEAPARGRSRGRPFRCRLATERVMIVVCDRR